MYAENTIYQGFHYEDGKKYDGTIESIEDKSHRPHGRHPNAHTNQEIRWIRNYVRRNPRITICELWVKLKREKGYTRTIVALYRVMHHKIRPRTPQHNGKVERSHRNDNDRFYSYLKFYSLEDLREQGKRYLKRSNNIPMAVLKYQIPQEKRIELETFDMVKYAI